MLLNPTTFQRSNIEIKVNSIHQYCLLETDGIVLKGPKYFNVWLKETLKQWPETKFMAKGWIEELNFVFNVVTFSFHH